ncbi:MAG TPA: sugar phosphate nucleotidyltransferase [Anaerolineae bacterium]|nr:sugar phosphate nucleotidyltransferase [Anaerolineae bacterium]HQK15337.1 sugar phosphate nucleotidyltransferase [Anaerolineae bacterium]
MTANPTLIVMAAGLGSRYGGIKQIEPVGPHGATLLDYAVYDALRAGFGKVVFVINTAIETPFRERFGTTIARHCEVAYVIQRLTDVPAGFAVPPERKKPWGTGQAVLSCKDAVTGPFAVINADDFYGRAAFETLASHLTHAEDRDDIYDYCMVGYTLENTITEYGHVSRGICEVDDAGYLVHIREHTHIERRGADIAYTEDGATWIPLPNHAIVSMNIWGFTPGLFAELERRFPIFLRENAPRLEKAEFFLPDIVGDLVQEGKARVKVLTSDAQWFGVTYKEDRPRVQQAIRALIAQGIYPENLW